MGKQKKSKPKHKNNLKGKLEEKKNAVVEQNGSELLYKIQISDTIGRYLVATRNLTAGEIIMLDEPLVVGPCQEGKPLCIGCYVDIDLNNPHTYRRCNRCSWPLCSSNCIGYHTKYGHSQEECSELSKSKLKETDTLSFKNYYYALTPFRCLVLQKSNPEKWNIIKCMESHIAERKKLTELWSTNEKMAVNVIRDAWELKEFSEDQIHFACGVLEVNAFEVNLKNGMQSLRAIYPNAFLFGHDCIPNTRRSNTQEFQIIIRAMRGIQKGEMITVSYAYTLQSTLMRRRHLNKTKFFSCICKRCSDPTELGTYTGGMKCQICEKGFLLPENSLDSDSLWKCTSSKCYNHMSVSQIIPILDNYFKELDLIDGNDIMGYEKFIKKCSSLFHENHYLVLSAMHCLSQLYGKINQYLINDLTEEDLERKEEICRRLIKMFEKFEPGLSKQKGILLYELQAPLMVLVRRKCQSMTKKELKTKLKEVLKYLNESSVILSMEPNYTAEGQMATAAKEAITNLQDWLNFLS